MKSTLRSLRRSPCRPAGFWCASVLLVASVTLAGGCGWSRSASVTPSSSPLTVQGTMAKDEIWEGRVEVADDFLVPMGRTLKIRAGTTVLVHRADTSRTEPEFLFNSTEFLVRGRLIAEGSPERPVVFEPLPATEESEDEGEAWAGIIFDQGGGSLRHAAIKGGEYGILLLSSSPGIEAVSVTDVKHGLALHGPSSPRIEGLTVDAAEGGIYCWPGSSPELTSVRATAAEREGLLVAPGARPDIRSSFFEGPFGGVQWGADFPPPSDQLEGGVVMLSSMENMHSAEPPAPPFSLPAGADEGKWNKVYRGENFIGRDEVWRGAILVDGTVMVAPGVLLTVEPGTVVRFTFRDTNGDGIGENELFIQGRISARGDAAHPIIFAAEGEAGPGRWGAINIMGSDRKENVFTFCLVESSYRGLHSHFSAFSVEHSYFRGNYRAVQFQESRASITGTVVSGNSSAMRFRDSTVALDDCRIVGNTAGIQMLRSRISLSRCSITANHLAGIHIRETEGTLTGNAIRLNTPGLRVSESRLQVRANRLDSNNFGGLLMRSSQVEVSSNAVTGNIGNGLSADSPEAVMRDNIFTGNQRFAIESDSPLPLDAVRNYWGVPEGEVHLRIYDGTDDDTLGPVLTDPSLPSPPEII